MQGVRKLFLPTGYFLKNLLHFFNVSKQTIYNKIKLFDASKGRGIDRLQVGTSKLVNEIELLEAMRLKTPTPLNFRK